MIDERKAVLIRVIFAFSLILAAVAAALFFDLPGLRFDEDKESDSLVQQADSKNIEQIRNQKNCVVVLHAHKQGDEDSERTRKILRELKEDRYSDVLRMAEFDVEEHTDIAVQEGVKPETAPQLSFYIEGQRVGDYRGPWSKPPVQRKIDAILHGYMQRIGKEWRPPVPGMDRGQSGGGIPIRLPEKPVEKTNR